jgi:hypothetical protein
MLACQEENKVAHTFALLIKTTDEGETGKNCVLETKAKRIAVCHGEPEQLQRNPAKSLPEVLEWAHSLGARTAIWGPYPVQNGFYEKVFKEAGREGGLAEIGNRRNPDSDGEMTTYLHAAANAGKGSNDLWLAGEANCLLVVRGLAPWIRPREKAPDWLHERLELKKYGALYNTSPTR